MIENVGYDMHMYIQETKVLGKPILAIILTTADHYTLSYAFEKSSLRTTGGRR